MTQTRVRVAIHQPNYLPWLGYFTKIANADVFVFLDDAQLPQGRSFVHRTRIHSAAGGDWLSAPVRRAERQLIRDVRFADDDWRRRHRATLLHTYRRTPHFEPVMALVDRILEADTDLLAAFNMRAAMLLADHLGLSCRFELSSAFGVESTSDERLIDLVKAVGGDTYLSGVGGQNYQDPAKFERAGIDLWVREFTPHPYGQGPGAFQPCLTILDALFNIGPADTVRHLSYQPMASPCPSA
ncbi:WbqC family protein [Azospirillum rugosum]|uniref:WbqC-like protein family protein n=1 Tax=Azospirillum rugosum TaxID=416170 RepID=A0ABS4SFD8_9PROT|nr:WbqC family protein [Azospirillum rugosum]MBP2291288.1 hypothetical protein [Azospirillum rugosum]MDQ0525076.1 hypothetical protein [Azospirillum rugosum]